VAAPYPFERLARVSRREAALQSAIATWIGARAWGERVARLVGGAVTARVVRVRAGDASARERDVRCDVRIAGAVIDVRVDGGVVRRIAQRVLGGPAELAAPRPSTLAERALWALVVATALEDFGVAGEVWPVLDAEAEAEKPPRRQGAKPEAKTEAKTEIEIEATFAGAPATIFLGVPEGLELRVPPPRTPPGWTERFALDAELVIGRCALPADALAALAVRDVVTLEAARNDLELAFLGGSLALRVAPGAVVAEVATGYVARQMSVPDDAHVELTVALGTMQLTLRQVCDLAIGQILTLGRPLAGPFEVRAAGRMLGKGELVDVDGELGVRIVSLSND
jgi:type III secretion protein Q